jgi:hypothetical protein
MCDADLAAADRELQAVERAGQQALDALAARRRECLALAAMWEERLPNAELSAYERGKVDAYQSAATALRSVFR